MKRALVVGINYVGTGYDLRGCINDANNVKNMLESKGFTDIRMLLEADATTANMKAQLLSLVTGARIGDVLVFHYSGHGSQLPSTVEPDGYEEIICPYDLNWRDKVITDDFLKSVFNTVPAGVNVTVILDCCNSGDGLDTGTAVDWTPPADTGTPVTTVSGNVSTVTTTNGGTVTISYSNKFLPPPDSLAADLQGDQPVEWQASRDLNATSILIAACKSYQTSADAFIDGTYQGAATYALLQAVKNDDKTTYRKLIASMQQFMVANRFTQTPVLDGADILFDNVFAEPFADAPVGEYTLEPPAPVIPDVPVIPAVPAPAKEDKTIQYVIFGAIILVIIVLFII